MVFNACILNSLMELGRPPCVSANVISVTACICCDSNTSITKCFADILFDDYPDQQSPSFDFYSVFFNF